MNRSVEVGVAVLLLLMAAHPVWAQAHNPFGVGISEGGGSANGVTGWILAQQLVFQRHLSAAIRAAKTDGSAVWLLVGLSFAYGVFHAAGPGHGKAVMISYMFANERVLRRGLVLTGLAALLQGLVAIVLVAVLAVALHATGQRMKESATVAEQVSYAGVALFGASLVWQKGRRLAEAVFAPPHVAVALPIARSMRVASAAVGPDPLAGQEGCACAPARGLRLQGGPTATGFGHDPACGHFHAPDPARLGADVSWSQAILTVFAAGARPCSGAILVLVFALAQDLFPAGIAATLAMSLGTAITTGGIAIIAVLARGVALRFAGPSSRRGILLVRGLETAVALVVLALGVSLFLGYSAAGNA